MFDPKALQKSAILGVLALTSLSILGSECVSNWEFLHSLGKELMVMIILPWKNMFVLLSLTWIWRFLNSHYQQQQLL